MRRVAATIATLTLVLGLASAVPAQADCSTPNCPVGVSILEGIGFVCSAATPKAMPFPGDHTRCVYQDDALWGGRGGPPLGQGLYWPGVGPPADGPFSFVAGPTSSPPTSICVSSQGGAGCVFDSWGMLYEGASGFGAYCGSSEGRGKSIFTGADGTVLRSDFGWSQSGATILPLVGKVTSSSGPGGPSNAAKGASVIGFTSSRGTGGGGNCGVTQVTTAFNVEGMVMTY